MQGFDDIAGAHRRTPAIIRVARIRSRLTDPRAQVPATVLTMRQTHAPRGNRTDSVVTQGWIQYNGNMQQSRRLTAIIEREGDGYVALCPELDVASQGGSLEEARANLVEALTLFFETADLSEIERRFHGELFITQVEVPIG